MIIALRTADRAAAKECPCQVCSLFFIRLQVFHILDARQRRKPHRIQEGKPFSGRLHDKRVDILLAESSPLPHHRGRHEAEILLQINEDAARNSAVSRGEFQSPAAMAACNERAAHAQESQKLSHAAVPVIPLDTGKLIFHLFGK